MLAPATQKQRRNFQSLSTLAQLSQASLHKVINAALDEPSGRNFPRCKAAALHHREFESLSKLSRANKSNHFRSDPVRVQSTVKQRQQTANYTPAKEKRYLCPPGLNSRAYADCRSQKFCCGRPQRSLLGLYRPQSAMSCSTLRERAA